MTQMRKEGQTVCPTLNATLGYNRRYLPTKIPLTPREVALGLKKPPVQWTETELIHYLTECRRFGMSLAGIGKLLGRSPSWVTSQYDKLAIPIPPKPPKKEYQSKRKKPSAPKRYCEDAQ